VEVRVKLTIRPLLKKRPIMGGLVGLRAGVDTVAKRKIPVIVENLIPGVRSIASSITG
jgi:hypothetical protein